jgi:hypothetical protein
MTFKYLLHVFNINILNDLDHKLFTIFINESCDISVKEKMILILHHVDVKECVWWMFFFFVLCMLRTQLLYYLKMKLRHCLPNMDLVYHIYMVKTKMKLVTYKVNLMTWKLLWWRRIHPYIIFIGLHTLSLNIIFNMLNVNLHIVSW